MANVSLPNLSRGSMPGSPTATALLPEVDRQLGDQRAQADAFATRAGLLIAAAAILTGVLSGVLSGPLGSRNQLPTSLLWILGAGVVAGVLVLCMSRVSAGPSAVQMTIWMSQGAAADDQILQAKLLAVQVNSRALLRTEVIFILQAVATAVGVVLVAVQLQGVSR